MNTHKHLLGRNFLVFPPQEMEALESFTAEADRPDDTFSVGGQGAKQPEALGRAGARQTWARCLAWVPRPGRLAGAHSSVDPPVTPQVSRPPFA